MVPHMHPIFVSDAIHTFENSGLAMVPKRQSHPGSGARALACAAYHLDHKKQTDLMEGKKMGLDQLIKLSPCSATVLCSGPGLTWA